MSVDLLSVGSSSVSPSNVSDYLAALRVEHEAVEARSRLTTWAAVHTWIVCRDFGGDVDVVGSVPTSTGEFAVAVSRAPSYGTMVKALTFAYETFGASPHFGPKSLKSRVWSDIVQGRISLKALKSAASLKDLYAADVPEETEAPESAEESVDATPSGSADGACEVDVIESAVLTWLSRIGSADAGDIERMVALMDRVHDGIEEFMLVDA